ncbi:MAG: hypothetical protein KGZ71_07080 [Desulfobulbaceae bacterium]|nr:hypothetical protein [Candidatus Kapabacteria bacterium]MBS4000228.1 hypothetical protein [Desulfobulbaceae bacterium]
MKTLLFLIAFFLIQIELFAQCPPDYDGPETVTIQVCEGCSIQATWCCGTVITLFGNKPAIHFSDILVIGENCINCLDWAMTPSGWGVPAIPWELLIGAVMGSHKLCYEVPPVLPPCDPAPPASYNMIVTNGGCYTRTETLEGIRYTPCDTDVQALCYENYKICWEFVNGDWSVRVEGSNKQPAFNCMAPDCYPMCE